MCLSQRVKNSSLLLVNTHILTVMIKVSLLDTHGVVGDKVLADHSDSVVISSVFCLGVLKYITS